MSALRKWASEVEELFHTGCSFQCEKQLRIHDVNLGTSSGQKKTCQRHCFSTMNHNLAYCYNDARVMKWLWTNLITNRLNGGARSFED